MTTLAADAFRDYMEGNESDVGAIAADIIFRGAAVGNDAGFARPLVAGDQFIGFAMEKVDNALGAAGDKKVRLRRKGIVRLNVASAAATSIGAAVWASDDDTFVLTQSTNSFIGRIVHFVSSGIVDVAFNVENPPLANFTALTDSSGGTAADTIAAIGVTYDQAEVRDAVASLAAKINLIEQMVRGQTT